VSLSIPTPQHPKPKPQIIKTVNPEPRTQNLTP
jgi:hypothetical protein